MSVSGLRKALKGDLDWLVVKALEKERGRRYQSASALGDDLQRYLDHEPLEAGPPSIGYRLQKLLRRNRGKFLAAGLLLLTMVGGAVATYVQWQRAEDQARDNLALAESERAAKDEERVAKEEALRATRLANLRSVQLAARQGRQARVLELVDPLIETAADNDELVDLLLIKVEAQVNSGKRPFQETYRQLLELDASKAESPRVKVAVAYQRALVGANAAKTKRAFTELLAAGGLTQAQEALCRALSTESVQDAIEGLRAALELGSYDPGAAGMLSVLAGMTADKDLLLELRATERAARAGYTGLTSADVWLAVTADEPLADGVLESDPRLRELAVAV